MNSYDLVLVGGGHTHVLLIRALAMRPIPGVRVTLISENLLTPYSGMLPGYVAGHYLSAQTTIDLNKLCRRAGVRWIKARVVALDPDEQSLSLASQAAVSFDRLSIDIGSTPDLSVKGASEFATGVKPIARFQQRWNQLLRQVSASQALAVDGDWGVVGAGAGGVELVLAMAHRMQPFPQLRFHLIYQSASILPGYPVKVVTAVERRLRDYGVSLHANFSVKEVTAQGVSSAAGQQLALTESIWCTGALGAQWAADSGLASTDKNFICVNEYLQSTSHPAIFAAGDIAEMVADPRPKAGVYAVRQAPQLEENLRRAFNQQPLRKVKLQTQFLSLLSLGAREAIASRNGLVAKGRWVWRWKDYIDQKFMRQFETVRPTMAHTDHAVGAPSESDQVMHCGGCGSKLGPKLLSSNLQRIAASTDLGADAKTVNVVAEDASVWRPTAGTLAVQSTDGFRSFAEDGYRFGRICVNHALSDIYAMGAGVKNAQSWINVAFGHARIQQRDHLRLLWGIVDALREQGAELSGGHSSEGVECHLAIVANGEVRPDDLWNKGGAQSGDVLVLSKSLGTGVILAADMQGAAPAAAIDAAYTSMLSSNQASMHQLQNYRPHAVTDVTGFGLLGHLLEILNASEAQSGEHLTAVLQLAAIPVLPGALDLAAAGWRSSLYLQLLPYLGRCQSSNDRSAQPVSHENLPVKAELLLDPQTSGGLLACMAQEDAQALLNTHSDFIEIGRIERRAAPASAANSVASVVFA